MKWFQYVISFMASVLHLLHRNKHVIERGLMPRKKSSNYDAVLIEQLHSKVDTLFEHVSGVESRLVKHLNDHDARFDMIDGVLMQNGARLNRIQNRLDGVEVQLSCVQHKIDDVTEVIKQHERALKSLQA